MRTFKDNSGKGVFSNNVQVAKQVSHLLTQLIYFCAMLIFTDVKRNLKHMVDISPWF